MTNYSPLLTRPIAPGWSHSRDMRSRKPDLPEVVNLRLAIAATIAAILKAPDEAEHRRLVAERNRLGKQLAHLLKSEQVC